MIITDTSHSTFDILMPLTFNFNFNMNFNINFNSRIIFYKFDLVLYVARSKLKVLSDSCG